MAKVNVTSGRWEVRARPWHARRVHIYLVRHAIAEPRGDKWADEDRPLTLEGIERFERSVKGLRKLKVEFDAVLHSPWRRAVETAQRLTPVLGGGRRAETAELAMPPRRELLELIHGESVAVVGHQPWLADLLAWLTTGDVDLGERFVLKKGGVAWLDGEATPGGCALRAVWTPRTLRTCAPPS